MNNYPHLADTAWLRLVIVGLDILAVVVTVRVYSMLTAWWRSLRAPRPARAGSRTPGRPAGHSLGHPRGSQPAAC